MKTHNILFSMLKRKSPLIILNLQPDDFFQGTQEQVRNSRDKRAISVRAIEVLLYLRSLKCLKTMEKPEPTAGLLAWYSTCR